MAKFLILKHPACLLPHAADSLVPVYLVCTTAPRLSISSLPIPVCGRIVRSSLLAQSPA